MYFMIKLSIFNYIFIKKSIISIIFFFKKKFHSLLHKLSFFKSYIVKGGVRNGLLGLLIAQKHYTSVQLKYSRMWFYQEEKKK